MTHIADVDLDILSKLSLHDLQHACQRDQYFSNLCKDKRITNRISVAKIRANNIINYFNEYHEFNLHLNDRYDTNDMTSFLSNIGINALLINPDDLIFSIPMYYKPTGVAIYFSNNKIVVNNQQLKTMLIYLFYDNMVFLY